MSRRGRPGVPPQRPPAAAGRRAAASARPCPRVGPGGLLVLIDLFNKALHIAQQGGECPPLGDGLGGVATMLEGRDYCPWVRPAPCRRASGSARSASPATGSGSRPASGLGNAGSGAWAICFAWGCSSDFTRSLPPPAPSRRVWRPYRRPPARPREREHVRP
jgi:hypothetical protein